MLPVRKLTKPVLILLALGVVVAGARMGIRATRSREIGVCVYTDYAFRQRPQWQELLANRFREVNRTFQNTKVQWKMAGEASDDPTANMGGLNQRRIALRDRLECKADVAVSFAGLKEGRREGIVSPFSRVAIIMDYADKSEQDNTRALIRLFAVLFGAPIEPAGTGTVMTEPPEGDALSPKTVALVRELRDYNFAEGIDGLTPEWEQRAVKALQAAAYEKSGSPGAQAHRVVGTALVNELRAEKGVAHFREAVRIEPGNASLHAELAGALSQISEHAEAVKELAEAVRLEPKNALFHGAYAGQLAKQGDSEAALEEMRKAIELAPANPLFPISLGTIAQNMGRSDEAVAAFQSALKISPDLPAARIGLERAEALKQKTQAEVAQRRLHAQKNPSDANAQYDVGVAEARAGNLDAAARAFERSATMKPTAGRSYAGLAMVHYLRGDYKAAWKAVNTARTEKFEPPASLISALKRKQPE
jgi:tetratricopeptide (TPR) repeat protein